MKIVDHKTFLTLPKGTVYRKWQPDCYEEICIFTERCGENDFLYKTLQGEAFEGPHTEFGWNDYIPNLEGIEVEFHVGERDGCFGSDYMNGKPVDQMYAVYEKEEIEAMIEMLKECI